MHGPGPSFGVRLAYIISAYKNLDQVSRLIRRLDGEGAMFLVHVDKKTSEAEYRALADDVGGLRGVELLERHTCHWGGFGHVRATLKGISRLAARGFDFEYLILLTGQDYPIKSNAFIERFFAARRGTSFMLFDSLPTEWWSERGGLDRVEYPHVRFKGHHARIPVRRSFPRGLKPYGGGAYWSLSREAVEYVSRFTRDRSDVVTFFKRVDIPDEIFFQTVLLNSPLAKTIVNDHLRYIDWTRGPGPAVLETSDFEALASSPQLFARKFDARHDERILDLIDERLLERDDAMPPPVVRGLSG
jgi:hypothetical protein